jgi:thiol:disulfide interchange protein
MKVLAIVMITMGLMGLSFVNAPSNSPEGINFENISFEDALKKAKKEKKLIFVDAYAVWCGPCKWMEANTFREKEVGDAFNKKFINLKIDMEKGEGPELARKYNVRAYPTMFLIDGDGKVVKRILGAKKKDQLLSEVEEYIN